MELRNEREILIQLSADVKHLTKTIEDFAVSLKELEMTRIGKIEDELADLKTWKLQVSAGWKVVVVIASLVGTAAGYVINHLLK